MWEIQKVSLINLFSHKQSTYTVQNNQLTMLLGINQTEPGANSNGAGKSSIIEAITLALTGDVFRGVKRENFIRHGKQWCSVTIALHNAVLDRTLEVQRTIHLTKSSEVHITINGEVVFDSKRDRTKRTDPEAVVFNELGITKEDFLNYFVIGQGNRNSFFTCGDARQKQIISRFSNFDKLDSLLAQLKVEMAELEDEKETLQGKLDKATGWVEAIQEQIEAAEQEFAEQQDALRQDCRERLAQSTMALAKLNQDRAADIHAHAEAAQVERQLTKQARDPQLTIAEIEALEERMATLNKDTRQMNKRLGELANLQGQIITCPKCNNPFIPGAEYDIAEVEKEVKTLGVKLTAAKNKLNGLEQQVDALEQQLNTEKKTVNDLEMVQRRLQRLSDNVEDYEKRIAREKQRKADIVNELEAIKNRTVEAVVAKHRQKLEGYLQQQSELSESIAALVNQLNDKKFFEFHFGKKGLKTYLANRSIKNIQDICNFYLNKFDTDMQVLISGYRTLKNGDLKDEIEVNVVKSGMAQGVFNKYSGGEKSRVDLCGIIAIHSLINNAAPHGKGLNFLGLDENIAYLDAQGHHEVVKILSKAQKTILLVMQLMEDMPLPNGNKVYIVKENGISKIQTT